MLAVLPTGRYLQGQLLHSSMNKNHTLVPLEYECTHTYTIEILSIDPVVIYINDFITNFEIDHLINKYV